MSVPTSPKHILSQSEKGRHREKSNTNITPNDLQMLQYIRDVYALAEQIFKNHYRVTHVDDRRIELPHE